jgi:hypothetical protein
MATFELEKLDDGEVYTIIIDYDCDLIPQDLEGRLENMVNGNKMSGKLREYEYYFVEIGTQHNTVQFVTVTIYCEDRTSQ